MKINLFVNLLLTFVLTTSIESQQFDPEFLESLSPEVRADLLKKIEEDSELEEPQYRRPSTLIEKPGDDEEFLEEIKEDRFGEDIFSMMQTTLMPINEANFDSDYILDFGDVLELQMVGQVSSIVSASVRRDGSVSVPDIGKLFVSGLSLQEATDMIKSRVESSLIGINVFVTLSNVRDIQVVVAGNAYSPGSYTLNGNSNIFHALVASGGPSEIGSFRKIILIRDNEEIEEVDLYDTFIYGRSSYQRRLRSGDIIFISPVGNLVSVSGGIKRPSLYEIKDDEKLDVLIKFGNGITSDADLSEINLYRFIDGKITVLDVNQISDLSYMSSRDADKLFIRKYPIRIVQILGAIRNPGFYIVNEGEGILESINRAGGYTESAYPFGGVLESRNAREVNKMASEELYKTFINSLATASNISTTETDVGAISLIMEEIKSKKPSGRVNAEFNLAILEANKEKDILLQDGDTIVIPERTNQVYVYGEVSSEGTVMFDKSLDIEGYIMRKGGFTSQADKKQVFVLNPNGETFQLPKNMFSSRNREFDIYPGSVIFVPRKINSGFFAAETAQAYASILGNIGVSLASISVLKD